MSIGYLFFCLISESQRLRRCDATLQVTVPCLAGTGVLSPLRRRLGLRARPGGEPFVVSTVSVCPCWVFVPEPGIEPTPPALGGFLATGSPQKSLPGGFRRESHSSDPWVGTDGTLGALLPCSVSGRTAELLALMWRACDPGVAGAKAAW